MLVGGTSDSATTLAISEAELHRVTTGDLTLGDYLTKAGNLHRENKGRNFVPLYPRWLKITESSNSYLGPKTL